MDQTLEHAPPPVKVGLGLGVANIVNFDWSPLASSPRIESGMTTDTFNERLKALLMDASEEELKACIGLACRMLAGHPSKPKEERNTCTALIVRPDDMQTMYDRWLATQMKALLTATASRPQVPRSLWSLSRYLPELYWGVTSAPTPPTAAPDAAAPIAAPATAPAVALAPVSNVPLPAPSAGFMQSVTVTLDTELLPWVMEWEGHDWGEPEVPRMTIAALDWSGAGVPCTSLSGIDWSPCGVPDM